MTARTSSEDQPDALRKKKKRLERFIDRTIAFADRAPADPLQSAYLDDVSPMEAIRIATGVSHER